VAVAANDEQRTATDGDGEQCEIKIIIRRRERNRRAVTVVEPGCVRGRGGTGGVCAARDSGRDLRTDRDRACRFSKMFFL
jgi:hypothetical protein